jgi:hypothetical protein
MIPAVRILERLVESQLEFVVIGGVAALAHGATMMTRDIDVCMRLDESNLEILARILKDLNPRHRITPQKIPFNFDDMKGRGVKNLYLETDWGVLDCLGEVLGIGGYDEVAKVSEVSRLPFGECRVLTLDGLIRAKEATGRPHDLLTVRQLKLIREKGRNS